MTIPPVFGEARYRTIDEARIIEAMVTEGWRYEVAGGRRGAAETAARAALEQCVGLGLPFARSPAGVRLFDPAEASNSLKWSFRALGEGAWEKQFLPTARRQIWEPHGPAHDGFDVPPRLSDLAPQRYAVTVRRTFNLSDLDVGARLRLRLPLPIEDAFLRDLAIEVLAPAETDVATTIAPARLDAVLAVPEKGEVSLGVRATFTAGAITPDPRARPDAQALALYTRPSEGMIKVSPRVAALAAELAGADADPMAILRRIWAFVLDALGYGYIHNDAIDPAAPLDWVLEHGWYDCKIGAALIAALCRARGIPARLVSGYVLCAASPGFHTWTEAWIDGRGWLPLDLSSWSLSAAGRDAEWRDFYFGRLDHRMTVERPPRLFSAPNPMRLPEAWQMLINLAEPGSDVIFEDLATGALICREHIEVERLAPGS